jgi:hypothetical protein
MLRLPSETNKDYQINFKLIHPIGCRILEEPFFFPRKQWIPRPGELVPEPCSRAHLRYGDRGRASPCFKTRGTRPRRPPSRKPSPAAWGARARGRLEMAAREAIGATPRALNSLI